MTKNLHKTKPVPWLFREAGQLLIYYYFCVPDQDRNQIVNNLLQGE